MPHREAAPDIADILNVTKEIADTIVERERVASDETLIHHAAASPDAGAPDAILPILAAKAEVASCCIDTVNDVMTLAGGIGYENNSLLGMLLRDARASHVMTPTTDILYTWIGRTLLDQPLLSE